MMITRSSGTPGRAPRGQRDRWIRPLDSLGAAELLNLLQHQQFSPVQVRHHRYLRKDLFGGIVQGREVVEVKNLRLHRS
jgi:hypothetical protein